MNIQRVPIAKIQRARYNPRKTLKPGDPAYDRLKKAVSTFGLVEPLVWNERTGNLVGGHQRLSILEECGETEVDVSVVDLDDREEKTLNLALNKHAGEWDFATLADLLQELDAGDLDMEITGFTEAELEKLMTWTAPNSGLTDEDATPEPPKDPVTRRGDLWILGKHRVLCGDSTNTEHVAKLCDGTAIDLTLADPPYCSGGFQESGKGAGSVGTNAPHKQIANDMLSTRGYQALLRKAFQNLGAPFLYSFTDWRMWVHLFDVAESSGYGARSMIVWDKQSPGMGRGWRAQHELILWACQNVPPFDKHASGTGNVIQCTRTGNIHHTTEKPVEVIERLLLNTPFAKTVADPFMGSGTVLIAAEKSNRSCFGMELDPVYVDVIVKRWEEFTGEKAELQRETVPA